MIQPGEYRHRVSFRQKNRTSDGQGGSSVVRAIVATVHCEVRELTGRELQQAQQLSATATHRIRMYFRTGITNALDVLWVNKNVRRTLNVETVQAADTVNEELFVFCSELKTT